VNIEIRQILWSRGIATPADIESAHQRAALDGGCLIEYLAGLPSVDEEALADCLAEEAGTLMLDLEQGELDVAAVRMVRREDAWARCLIPVALEVGEAATRVRVAMADPLDTQALEWLEHEVECPALALGATVSGVHGAIEKYLGPRPSALPPLTSEPTRRVAGRDATSEAKMGTVPAHRVGSEASPAQRIEALVLALVAKGVLERSDYEDALKRILQRSSSSI
jgi:hypothetical protein